MVRGLEGKDIFLGDADRRDLLERLASVVSETGARVYAWALMPNHFHVLIQSGPVRLSTIMRRILTDYAVSFNRRHRRVGHLFQNRYKSVLVEKEPYLLELVRYIHLNPLRGRLVKDINELASFPWSGHSVLMGRKAHPWQDADSILGRFTNRRREARRAYREFVEAATTQGRRSDLVGGGLVRSVGGWAQVNELRRGRERWVSDERILGSSDFVARILEQMGEAELESAVQSEVTARDLSLLIQEVAARFGLSPCEVTGGSRRRQIVEARAVVSYAAIRRYGMSLTEIAHLLHVSVQSVIRAVKTGGCVLQQKGWVVTDLVK
jgi:REP element-mobilizing transposase RayT